MERDSQRRRRKSKEYEDKRRERGFQGGGSDLEKTENCPLDVTEVIGHVPKSSCGKRGGEEIQI